MHTAQAVERVTYFYDRVRGSFQGVVQAGALTFGLLVAIRYYEASPTLKAGVSAAHSFGLLFTPFCLLLFRKTAWRSTAICSGFLLAAGVLLFLSGLVNNLYAFVCLLFLAMIALAQQAPFMIQVYSLNYPTHNRGSRLSTSFMLMAITGSLFSYFGGRLLDAHLSLWPFVFFIMAFSSVAGALAVMKIPSRSMRHFPMGNPLENISLIWKDKLFGWLLLSWFFMGLANLMIIPLRIEYLANPEYKINASNEMVALLTFIIPAAFQIISTRFWGRLFDRTNFIVLRNCINTCFLISILLFFNSTNLIWIAVGSVFFGIGSGGGNLVWNLWVTKLAPPEKVQSYMSVHTWTTGVRGVMAPFLGFYLLHQFTPSSISIVCALSIFVSGLMFVTARGNPRLA